ncbi:MAG: PrgI family mobile element protein [Candidatus Nealsonbacteria bacterium]
MRFTVPQFIEHEAKIVGPLTFKQFIYVGIAGAICFMIYFSAPFSIFIIACVFIGGASIALAFLKVGGRPLPSVVISFLKFKLSPKMYLWKKKEGTISVLRKAEKKEIEEETPLKIVRKSHLKNIQTEIETKTK